MLIFKINFEKYHYHTSIKLPINQHLQANYHPHINIGINKKRKHLVLVVIKKSNIARIAEIAKTILQNNIKVVYRHNCQFRHSPYTIFI